MSICAWGVVRLCVTKSIGSLKVGWYQADSVSPDKNLRSRPTNLASSSSMDSIVLGAFHSSILSAVLDLYICAYLRDVLLIGEVGIRLYDLGCASKYDS